MSDLGNGENDRPLGPKRDDTADDSESTSGFDSLAHLEWLGALEITLLRHRFCLAELGR
jgi:acyl carrier protein